MYYPTDEGWNIHMYIYKYITDLFWLLNLDPKADYPWGFWHEYNETFKNGSLLVAGESMMYIPNFPKVRF